MTEVISSPSGFLSEIEAAVLVDSFKPQIAQLFIDSGISHDQFMAILQNGWSREVLKAMIRGIRDQAARSMGRVLIHTDYTVPNAMNSVFELNKFDWCSLRLPISQIPLYGSGMVDYEVEERNFIDIPGSLTDRWNRIFESGLPYLDPLTALLYVFRYPDTPMVRILATCFVIDNQKFMITFRRNGDFRSFGIETDASFDLDYLSELTFLVVTNKWPG